MRLRCRAGAGRLRCQAGSRYIITRQPAVVQVPCPSSAGELGQGTWTTAGCRVTSSLSLTPRFQAQAPIPQLGPGRNLDKNLDKELGQVLTRVFLLQSRGTWTRNLGNCGLPCYKLSQYYAPIPGRPRFHNLAQGGNLPELGQELGQGFWTSFITCFPLAEPLVQVRPGNLDKELGQLRAAVLQALSVLRPDSRQAPIPQLRGSGRKPELGQELGQGTWTSFITCFPLQVRPGNLDKELGQLRAALLKAIGILRQKWIRFVQ